MLDLRVKPLTHLLKLRHARFNRSTFGVVLFGFFLAACSGSSFDAGRGDASAGGAAAAGGAMNGGGGSAATGGVSSTCSQDSDCTNCAYTKAPEDSSQCYCAICAGTPMTKSLCDANQSAWQKNCANVAMACPAIACVLPPAAVCANEQCVAGAAGTTN